MFGLLNVAKPAGLTSRDVVNRVQRLVRPHKVGHAGTLDPLATGVLVIGIGPATRLVEYVQRMPKTYVGTFLLGRSSDTEDITGEVVELPAAPVITRDEVLAILPRFLGTIQQLPPAFSALKVAGQRAYTLARRGETVELAARPVEVHALELLDSDYPELRLLVCCGSGTYVRSLGRDIARALGTEAVMAALQRQAIGGFMLADAVLYDHLSAERIRDQLLPPVLALADLPQVAVTAEERRRIGYGQLLANRWNVAGPEVVALDDTGNLLAILTPAEGIQLRPTKGFAATQPE
ncbi:MAG: tRNA pseudouridine(55) synthase TruB [Pirellulaceae bacterium]|nr:tRNA pseudouridine(55) synthase TruB [Pirellulaceae bacterium]